MEMVSARFLHADLHFFLWKLACNLWVATLTLGNPILTPFHTLVLHLLCFSPESIMTMVTQGDFEFHRPSHFLLSRTTLSCPHVFIHQRRLRLLFHSLCSNWLHHLFRAVGSNLYCAAPGHGTFSKLVPYPLDVHSGTRDALGHVVQGAWCPTVKNDRALSWVLSGHIAMRVWLLPGLAVDRVRTHVHLSVCLY